MITTFLLTVLLSFLSLLVGFLPTGSLPAAVATSVTSLWGYVNAFSYVLALDTLLQVLVLVVAFDITMLLWHIIQWIIRKIPGMQ